MTKPSAENVKPASAIGAAGLSLAALGVVFGDIGTSPLYTLKTVLNLTGVKPVASTTLGALSLILWTLFIVTTVKYVNFAITCEKTVPCTSTSSYSSLIVTSYPRTKPSERVQVARVADKFWRIEARYGFMERPNVLAILNDCRTKGAEINRDEVIFYIGHETIIPRDGLRGIPRWQEAIFAAMARNSVRITDVLKLPHDQVVEIGREVAI